MSQPSKDSSQLSAAVQPQEAHVAIEEPASIQSTKIQARAPDGSELPNTASWGPEPDATGPEPDATGPEPDAISLEADATSPAPSPRIELSPGDSAKRQSVVTDVVSVEEIVSRLRLASIFNPEARLIFCSHSATGEDTAEDSAVVHRLPTDDEKSILCVAQKTQDVDFTFDIQIDDPSRPSQSLNFIFQVLYDPGSDQCLFINKAQEIVCLTNISRPRSTQSVTPDQQCPIQPGAWKISSETTEDRLVEFLLCKRQYTLSICQENDGQVEQSSPDSQDIERSTKRRKLSANTSTKTATSKKDLDSHYTKWLQMFTSFQKGRRSLTDIALPDLPDGGIATIQTPLSQNVFQKELSPSTYQLKRIREIATTSNTLVFSCQHSIYQDVAVKVLQYKDRSLDSLARSARLWKREKDLLLKLKHRNIVSLEAFDGRFFSLYLELLPLSLNRGLDSPFSLFEASIILKDISSALMCLKEHRIAHNDIKPNNIAYSFNRGAVLFDFGIASSLDDIQARGTPWYVPPELMDRQRSGFAGDVWAFGVTMLYVLKKVQLPEKMTEGWDIFTAKFRYTEDHRRWKQWLKIVAKVRKSLDRTEIIEDLVFQMLDTQGSRITAAEIEQALERK